MNIGYVYLKMGEFAEAEKAYRAATASDPKSPREAIRLDPSLAEAHYRLGITNWQSSDLDAALPELKEAIRLDSSTPGPFNTLGQILRIKGDKQASEEAFATGARLKREKEGQLANTLEQGMRGGSFPKPLSGPSR
jgi:Tfp pilus assembly protein PilF